MTDTIKRHIKFLPGVVCEDIRQEANGKFVLIGTYASEILVPQFPANLNLAFWLPTEAISVGKVKVEIRVVGANEAVLNRAQAEGDMRFLGRGAFPIPPATMQIQTASNVELQIKEEGAEWETVVRIPVKLNETAKPTQ